MGDRDFAIVVGIRRYPDLSDELRGPDNDAKAIYDWLVSSSGGEVPKENVRLIRSSDYPDPFPADSRPQPISQDVIDAFAWVALQAQRSGKIGRRLYLYFAGHGFGDERTKGGIFTANANSVDLDHVFVSSWFNWFVNSALFDECILWFDACMARTPLPVPRPASFPERVAMGAAKVLLFVAFAARFPAKSVEIEVEGKGYHGAFTHTLLNGLGGKAADSATGAVSTSSLRNYLNAAMREQLSTADLQVGDVSESPDFGPVDDFVLASGLEPLGQLMLRFPESLRDKPFSILGKRLEPIYRSSISSLDHELALSAGFYSVAVEGSQFSTFEYLGEDGAVIDIANR